MNFKGLIIGAVNLLVIGAFHPVVIKAEYHFGQKPRAVFLVLGILSAAASLAAGETFVSALFAVFACTFFWSIHELKEQQERVKKGWFPANPNRRTGKQKEK